ncbi:gamma-glutamylcyclotransferase [Klebsiella pneumoniae]|nr:gamma-glutamylcyclotransferase [Klebsiella pneumoniae]
MKPLFVYGTLCPGRSNRIFWRRSRAKWRPATSPAPLRTCGWGATADFGIVLDAHGPRVNGYLFHCPIIVARVLVRPPRRYDRCRWK